MVRAHQGRAQPRNLRRPEDGREMSGQVPIPDRALPAWRRLQDALEVTVTPCRGRGEWISQHPEDRAFAVQHCRRCPITELCRAYAEAAKERDGVWGGVDRTPRPGRPETNLMFQATQETA
jgi:hypothetical protein